MRLLVIWIAIGAAVSVKQELFELPKEKVNDTLDKFAIPCGKKYNIDPRLISKITDASIPQDEITKKFLHCFAFSGGYVEDDGHIAINRLAGIVSGHPLVEDFRTSLKKCNEITKENPVETTMAMGLCIANNAPIRFKF